MIVDPFWFGVGVGVFGTVLFETIILISIGISASNNAKKGNKQ